MKNFYLLLLLLSINTFAIAQSNKIITTAMLKNRYDIPSLKIGLKAIALAKKKLGKRYVWGAKGKNSFDCSGLTHYVYKKNGIKLPRRAIAQSKVGKRIDRKNLQKGDLIFFDTSKRRKGYVNHVGIYIGNNRFIHASSAKKRVVISSLKQKFYSRCFKGARRVSVNYLASNNNINQLNTLLNYF